MTDAPAAPATRPAPTGDRRWGLRVLLTVAAILLTVVIVSPILLSSAELISWAETGLGLHDGWRLLVPVALDCAAIACVLLAVYCALVGKGAGVFGLLVWVFAGFSSFANWRHGNEPGAPADRWWFFPVISLLGPALLEAVMHFIRRLIQTRSGKRAGTLPKFGLMRWLPVVGAPRDTYGARRTAQILGIATVDQAVATYHALCPDGSLRVVQAIRARDVATAKEAADEAARAARAAARAGVPVPTIQATNGADHPTRLRAVAATNGPSAATIRAAVATNHATSPTIHSDLAVEDAATIRNRWPDGLPDRGGQRMVRTELGWHAGKATNAVRAYQDQADLRRSAPPPDAAAGSGQLEEGSGAANAQPLPPNSPDLHR